MGTSGLIAGSRFRRHRTEAPLARAGTEVVLHGMCPATYLTSYPGNDIQYPYFQTLHSQQFAVAAIGAEQQAFDAFTIATLPEPSIEDIRAIVDIPVVGYGESAMLTSAGRPHVPRSAVHPRHGADDRGNVQRIGLNERFVAPTTWASRSTTCSRPANILTSLSRSPRIGGPAYRARR